MQQRRLTQRFCITGLNPAASLFYFTAFILRLEKNIIYNNGSNKIYVSAITINNVFMVTFKRLNKNISVGVCMIGRFNFTCIYCNYVDLRFFCCNIQDVVDIQSAFPIADQPMNYFSTSKISYYYYKLV